MKLPEQDNTFEYKFAKLKHSLKLRVLKIQLSNGDIELRHIPSVTSGFTLENMSICLWAIIALLFYGHMMPMRPITLSTASPLRQESA